MSQNFLVRASLLPGQAFYSRAGRGWTASPTLIEVLDQDDCPKLPCRVPGLPDVCEPNRVGRRAFAILLKDARISVKPEGEESADAMAAQVPGLQAKLVDAQSRIVELEGQLGVAQAEVSVLGAKLGTITNERDAHAKSAEAMAKQVIGLQVQLAEAKKDLAASAEKATTLESLLGDATKPTDPAAETKPAEGEAGKKSKSKTV